MKTPAGLFVPHMQLLVLGAFPRVLQNYQKGSESQFPTQFSIAGEGGFVKAWNVNILLIFHRIGTSHASFWDAALVHLRVFTASWINLYIGFFH